MVLLADYVRTAQLIQFKVKILINLTKIHIRIYSQFNHGLSFIITTHRNLSACWYDDF